jgi:hypothetical protein
MHEGTVSVCAVALEVIRALDTSKQGRLSLVDVSQGRINRPQRMGLATNLQNLLLLSFFPKGEMMLESKINLQY